MVRLGCGRRGSATARAFTLGLDNLSYEVPVIGISDHRGGQIVELPIVESRLYTLLSALPWWCCASRLHAVVTERRTRAHTCTASTLTVNPVPVSTGCRVVVAESYARIFFRNCIATGELYPCESQRRMVDEFETGEEAEVDMEANVLTRTRDGKQFMLGPLGDAAPVIDAGGLFEYARRAGMISAAS
jgi:hypothetical protein